MVTSERLKAIKERCERATPGPWLVHHNDHGWGILIPYDESFWQRKHSEQARRDMEFIAHARDDVPDLVAEVERLWDENRRLKLRLAELLAGAWKDEPELGRQIREDRET